MGKFEWRKRSRSFDEELCVPFWKDSFVQIHANLKNWRSGKEKREKETETERQIEKWTKKEEGGKERDGKKEKGRESKIEEE